MTYRFLNLRPAVWLILLVLSFAAVLVWYEILIATPDRLSILTETRTAPV